MSKALQRALEAKLAALEARGDEDSSDDEDDEHMEREEDEEENEESTSRRRRAKSQRLRDKEAKKKQDAAGTKASDVATGSSVIYIGHLPRGFEEHELKVLLKQFGKIVKLRLARSKKTGNSRGHAFCQFPTPEIAAIVADTFSGYLVMGQQRLVCHVVASDQVHRGLFHKVPLVPPAQRRELHRQRVNHRPKVVVAAKMKQITAGLLERERKKRDKMKDLGIDYYDAFPGYEASAEAMILSKETTTITVTTEKDPQQPPTGVGDRNARGKEMEHPKRLEDASTTTCNKDVSKKGRKDPRSTPKEAAKLRLNKESQQTKEGTATTSFSSHDMNKSSTGGKGRKETRSSPNDTAKQLSDMESQQMSTTSASGQDISKSSTIVKGRRETRSTPKEAATYRPDKDKEGEPTLEDTTSTSTSGQSISNTATSVKVHKGKRSASKEAAKRRQDRDTKSPQTLEGTETTPTSSKDNSKCSTIVQGQKETRSTPKDAAKHRPDKGSEDHQTLKEATTAAQTSQEISMSSNTTKDRKELSVSKRRPDKGHPTEDSAISSSKEEISKISTVERGRKEPSPSVSHKSESVRVSERKRKEERIHSSESRRATATDEAAKRRKEDSSSSTEKPLSEGDNDQGTPANNNKTKASKAAEKRKALSATKRNKTKAWRRQSAP